MRLLAYFLEVFQFVEKYFFDKLSSRHKTCCLFYLFVVVSAVVVVVEALVLSSALSVF